MQSTSQLVAKGLIALGLTLASAASWALKCDVDDNGRIDRADIGLIQQAIVQKLPVTGPDDPRDADTNNAINAVDSRICTLRCRYASCATNGAPVANAGAAATVRVGELATLSGAASSDPDGNPLTYAWSFTSRPAGSVATLSSTSAVSPTFTADRAGSYVLQLVVSDGSLTSAPASVTVSTRNSAPVANAGADQTARVGVAVTLDGRLSSDVDGDALTYAWRIVNAPSGSAAQIVNPTAVQPSLTLDVSGSYELELIVNDGNLASPADTVLVSTLNSAPVARPGNNRSVALGALVQLDGSGSSDVDGNSLTYQWSLLSRPAGSAAVLANASAVTPSFTADQPGSYVVQLIVNDGLVSSPAASLTISTDNAVPTANAGADQTVPLGAVVQLTGAASTDPEGSVLTYAWALVTRPAGSTATLANPTSATPSFTADRPGTYTAQLIVNDGLLASAPDTVVISTENSRPVADAGAAQAVDTGATVQLNGSASRDADGDVLTYAWSFTSRPAGSNAALNNAAAISPSFVADVPGSYVVQLIVRDATLASAPATVLVTVTTPNRAPVAAASATPGTVNVASPVSLSAAGSSDPDGNPITYSWSIALRPVGSTATISNPTSASASFVPDVAGNYGVLVTVSDGTLSASASASFVANAVATNRPPVIATTAPTAGTVSAIYAYDVDANDPDAGDTLSYSLTTAPAGMSIQPATGLITWTPTPAQLGSNAVTVRVADAAGLFVMQSFAVVVSDTPTALQVATSLTPAIANAGETVTLSVLVTGGNGGAVTRSATLDGAPLTLNASGVATFPAPASGVHRVNVLVQGSPVNGVTPAPQSRELILTVRDGSDTTAPTAVITTPAANSEVLSSVVVTGTATDARFAYYQLLTRPAGSSNWTEIHRGLVAVSNGALGTLDPSRLANGVYELGLNVVDVNGRSTTALVAIEVARDRKFGQFRIAFPDIRADASGIPLTLTRTYDSLKKDVMGDFGWGWTAGGQDMTVRKNMVFGQQWNVTTSGFNICLRPAGQRRITVTLPDGGVYRFTARNQPECAFAQVPELNIVLDALPLPIGGSSGAAAGAGQMEVIVNDSVLVQGGHLYNADTGEPWNPTDFRFTDSRGLRYVLREGTGVVSMTDLYGNTVNYGPGGVQHSASLGIQFTRDGQGRITRATDPAGRSLTYAYNSAGELASATDRVGQITYFQYDTATQQPGAGGGSSQNSAHLLSSITDPRGLVVMRQQFDEYGRTIGNADANGATASQTFDEANNLQRVVDRRGNASTYTFDAAGNITRVVDARGGITEFTYDANGNELTRRDPLGNVVTKTYNPVTGKVLTERDPLGRTVTTGYPTTGRDFERQNPVSLTDPLGRVMTFGYRASELTQAGAVPNSITEPLGRTTTVGQDSRGNLTSLTVAGIATTHAYDTRGRRTRTTDSLGNVTNFTFDDNGNELTRSVTRTVGGVPRTETTTRVYDAEKRVIQETDPTGAVRSFTYNGAGLVATSTDGLGRVTRNTYDANARLVRVDHPGGQNEQFEYDANGNLVSSTDRLGRMTRQVYDELDRLVQTVNHDGSSRSTEYDAAGRVTAEVDELGARRVNEYDVAGQLTASIDASGRRTEYQYDAAGNRTQTRLPDGRVVGYTYDALNRLTRTDYPDGTAHVSTYRPDGRKLTETDPRGVLTTYGYDAGGRLTSVIQSGLPATTTYSYDETGARTALRDAAGRQVTWRHDGAGRPVSRTLPDGAVETFVYDSEGQVTSYTTFGGQTITRVYDNEGREISRSVPATANAPARSLSWTYNADGQRATQTESGVSSAQGTTTFTYDSRGRMLQMAGPQGTLGWTYDAAGRITQRTTPEGSTAYQYDGDGRMTRVTAPDGKVVTYAYDAAGRMIRSEQALDTAGNAVLVTERRHDAQNRDVVIAHSRRVGAATTLVAGQQITRGINGAIARVDTFDGTASFSSATGSFTGAPVRAQTFEYDGAARLTQENNFKEPQLSAWLANGSGPATQTITYGYDGVGNRVSKSVVTAAGTESTSYAYDDNDRLTSETLSTVTGSTVVTTYGWDANGNMASRQRPGDYTGYVFDAENRLVEVRRGASPATATQVARYGYDADGQRVSKTTPAGSTTFLVDPTTDWPQVVLEASGTQRVAYVWGASLRQQARGTQGTVFISPSEDLVPLQGHLGSTIATIDRNAAVVEVSESTAFGELVNASPRLNHQFAGEYWDADSGLVQLRARWYAADEGRFLSLDPAGGRTSAPMTLNRYAYASGDPVQITDPSGAFGLGDVGAGLNISMNLALRAYNVYDFFSMLAPDEENDEVDGKPTLWDGLMGELVRAVFGGGAGSEASPASLASVALLSGAAGPRHHTIPEYVCGASAQEKVVLPYSDHVSLHSKLYGLHLSVKVGAQVFEMLFKKKKKGAPRSPVAMLARTPQGRMAIAEALHAFYESEGYWGMGVSERGARFGALGSVFLRERVRFTGTHHSYPGCKKK